MQNGVDGGPATRLWAGPGACGQGPAGCTLPKCAYRQAVHADYSPLGKAHTYLTNQRQALERFLEDGRLPLEKNACELLMRHVAVGRKNWLHCGFDKGAERLADIYTVLVTAKLQKADLAAGLAFVFDQLGRRTFTVEEARELLPDRWPKAQTDFGRAPVERANPPPIAVPMTVTG